MIYVFDIDGTLTESRRPMTQEMEDAFLKWSKNKLSYLVSGSDYEKIKEQVSEKVIDSVFGIFSCMGNQFWRKGKVCYGHDIVLDTNIRKRLNSILESSSYPHRYGNHIEKRVGLINFSIVGRKANLEQRKHYDDWNIYHGEHIKLVDTLSEQFPEFEFSIGGQISIDITGRGMNKSQVLDYLRECNVEGNVTFIGNRCEYPGNDFPLSKVVLDESSSNHVFSVTGPAEVLRLLESSFGN